MGGCDILGIISFNTLLIIFDIPVFFLAKICLCCCPATHTCMNKFILVLLKLAWKITFFLCCCWVRLRLDGLSEIRSEINKGNGKPRILIMNHVSFLDTIMAVYLMPLSQIGNVKMMASEHLFKMPVLGTLVTACGHLCVPFLSQATEKKGDEEVANFSVDKEAIKIVMGRLEVHVASGGIAAWFPEGRMNPDPTKLQLFRKGGFAMATRHACEIFCLVTCGNERCWPRKAAVGGRPARIGVKAFRLCENSLDFAAGEQDDKCLFIANAAHDKMQKALDELQQEGWCSYSKPKPPNREVLVEMPLT